MALVTEFEDLREKTTELPFWNAQLWENDEVTIEDWILVDAWYRSRCLEMPRAGNAMVPGLDMVNHAHKATAVYEEDNNGDVILKIRPECQVKQGEEISISYGDAKPAAEMLFSYGFIDTE